MKHNSRKLILIIAILLSGIFVKAQDLNSPYSYFGIGDLYNYRTAFNMSIGGVGIALKSPLYINYANPASYSGFDTTSFLIEAGLYGDFVNASTETETASSQNVQLGYLLIGFPITKWWKSSVGVRPFSNMGYLIVDELDQGELGLVSYNYTGEGGLNQFYWGNSFTAFKKLSFGVNLSYLFGSTIHDQVIDFPDSTNIQSFRLRNEVHVSDVLFNFGLQYTETFKNDLSLTLGLIYNANTNLNATRDVLGETFYAKYDGTYDIKDTIVYADGESGSVTYPTAFGGGISLHKGNTWLVSAEYSQQNWNDFQSFGVSDSLSKAMNVSVGGYYLPYREGITRYWERIHYRMGFRYSKSYLELRNNQISEFGLTFGVGLPVRGSYSTFNLALEVGQRGTLNNGLIKENFVRFTLGIAMFERWFIKRKFK